MIVIDFTSETNGIELGFLGSFKISVFWTSETSERKEKRKKTRKYF